MLILSRLAANWQKALPVLSVLGIAAWIALFRHDPTSERALFAALLVIYFVHQIEEHLWPGGFRQFTDAHVFHSGNDNWPVAQKFCQITGDRAVNCVRERPFSQSSLSPCGLIIQIAFGKEPVQDDRLDLSSFDLRAECAPEQARSASGNRYCE